ncbi:MAG: ATP-binding protein [Sphingomonas sp.]
MPAIELGVGLVAIAVLIGSVVLLTGESAPERMTPTLLALLLIANLVPATAVIMLAGRRFAKLRAAKVLADGGGQLHVRLVAIFSLLASVPIVLTVIAASFMFQTGGSFWITERARTAFEASITMVRNSQNQIIERWLKEGRTMVGDLERESGNYRVGSDTFHAYFTQNAFYRNFNQAALFSYTDQTGVDVLDFWQSPEMEGPPNGLLKEVFSKRITPKLLNDVRGKRTPFVDSTQNTLWLVYDVPGIKNAYLYVGTRLDAEFLNKQAIGAQSVIDEYAELQKSARTLQLRFNVALFGIALLIMAVTAWIALAVADRLVRPLNLLVAAARRAADGDLGVRVPAPQGKDEVATLGLAFNRMTARLEQQTNALVGANAESESRRALIEAVMSGVSAGILSIDAERRIRLINSSAMALLQPGDAPVGKLLAEVAPELDAVLGGETREDIVQLTSGGEARTLAVKITRDEAGQVLTFDDITQQLLDQRRAAWSDVARRIAHEIKNPLTPIQLAAERLQRRYGKKIESDDGTFAKLTDTIVRQVGDLRRMVDEFSSFARMPKPIFRAESIIDVARQTLFLHEVAKPDIRFTFDAPDGLAPLVCDRRQLGQALTNLVKNAVEAIETRTGEGGDEVPGEISMAVREAADAQLIIEIADNGIGLPAERERIVEPYMTTRARGTGLGLAIVKKIVEEHFGTMAFADHAGGGTVVTLCFDTATLERLAGTGGTDDAAPGAAGLAALTPTMNGNGQ